MIANADLPAHGNDAPAAYADACRRVDALVARLQQPIPNRPGEIDPTGPVTLPFTSNLTQAQFEAAVRTGVEYIRAGDIFQFVPSQRLRVHSPADPFDVYRALRIINPSPFMFYLKSPACTLIGSSPEILCRAVDGVVSSRPLAGTRRRGATEAEDQQLERELLADPKDRAEHIMLVDLHRNDVGRVAAVGSVTVSRADDRRAVQPRDAHHDPRQRPPGRGQDGPRRPAGEPARGHRQRGPQDPRHADHRRGRADPPRPLRRRRRLPRLRRQPRHLHRPPHHRLAARRSGGGTFDVQAGAGVVADSVPASEYEETLNKAKALLKAVEIAQAGF